MIPGEEAVPTIHDCMREMKDRNARIEYQVVEPGQVQRFLTKLGYLGPYDRCKYDVIYFQEEGRERAMVVWGLVE